MTSSVVRRVKSQKLQGYRLAPYSNGKLRLEDEISKFALQEALGK